MKNLTLIRLLVISLLVNITLGSFFLYHTYRDRQQLQTQFKNCYKGQKADADSILTSLKELQVIISENENNEEENEDNIKKVISRINIALRGYWNSCQYEYGLLAIYDDTMSQQLDRESLVLMTQTVLYEYTVNQKDMKNDINTLLPMWESLSKQYEMIIQNLLDKDSLDNTATELVD